MKKKGIGLFFRCFATILSVVFVTLFISSVLLLILVWHNNSSVLLNSYTESCGQLKEYILEKYEGTGESVFENKEFIQYFEQFEKEKSLDFFVVDGNGKIRICSDVFSKDSEYSVYNNSMEYEMRQYDSVADWFRTKADEKGDSYSAVEKFPLCTKNHLHYISAVSFDADRDTHFYVIITTPLLEASKSFICEHLRITLLAFLISVLIALFASWLASYHIFKPLQKVTEAARRYSHGDYTYRIKSHSRYREMNDLTDAFNRLAECLEKNEKSTQDFVANISHELKTPVTTISGFVDGILDGTIPPEKEKHYLQIVSDVCRRLTRLVVSMLNMAKIEAGKMEMSYSDFSLTDVVINTMLGFEKMITDKKIEVVGLDKLNDISIRAEESLITQVIYNLLDNAVKFTPENGMIKIGLLCDKRNVTLNILNTGNDIPENEAKNIFDRFYKSDKSRGLDTSGFGLGLHIVQSIVAMHGGTIKVTSQENEFVNFIVILPL